MHEKPAAYAVWMTKASTRAALSISARNLPTPDGDTTFTCLTETHYDTESGSRNMILKYLKTFSSGIHITQPTQPVVLG
jgi:hypothetical protein